MGEETSPRVPGVALALMAHTLWGSYAILAKLLLSRFDFPPLVFVASGQTIASLTAAFIARRYLRRSMLVTPALVALGLVSASRAITNILAVNYTLAIYVQLINLLTPFAVALLASLLFGEDAPPHTFIATLVATLGAALVITGNPLHVHLRWGPTDGLGIGLALVSVLTLAFWTLLTRLTTHRYGFQPTAVFVMQSSGVASISALSSVLSGQDWGVWGRLPLPGWLLFFLIVGLIMVGGNIVQITALSRLKAAFFSSLMAWRLVVALVLGALLLGERLESAWQVVGAVVVVVTVTLYLSQRVESPQPAAVATPQK